MCCLPLSPLSPQTAAVSGAELSHGIAQDYSAPEGQVQAAWTLSRLAELQDLRKAIQDAALPALVSLLQHGAFKEGRRHAATILSHLAETAGFQQIRAAALPALLALAQVRSRQPPSLPALSDEACGTQASCMPGQTHRSTLACAG